MRLGVISSTQSKIAHIEMNKSEGECAMPDGGINNNRINGGILLKCSAIALLILVGVRIPIASVAALLIACLMLAFERKKKNRVLYILFLYPFAEIFSVSRDFTSLFTMLYVAHFIMMLSDKRGRVCVMPSVIFLTGYTSVRLFVEDIANGLTLVLGFQYLYFVFGEIKRTDTPGELIRDMVLFFTAGLILASVIGLGMEYVPGLSDILQYKTTKLADASRITRFSGLVTSPASYSLDISLAIACVIALFYHKKIGKLFFPLLVVLFTFGFMTGSKSFLVSCAVLLMGFLLISCGKRLSYGLAMTASAVILGIIVYNVLEDETRRQLLLRFTSDLESGNVAVVTTGRVDIALEYLKYIFSDIWALLFGSGMAENVLAGKGTHNAYIELLYSFGSVGSVIYLTAVINVCHYIPKTKIKRRLIDYLPLVNMLIRLLGINLIYRDGVYFHYILVWCILYQNNLISDAKSRELTDL